MNDRPLSVTVCLAFILLNALGWLLFGIIVAVNVHPALPTQPLIRGLFIFSSIAIAGIMVVLFIYIRKHNRIAYFLSLAGFILASFLTVFDDFGWVDLIVLAINLIPIILLIKDRVWYLQAELHREGTISVT